MGSFCYQISSHALTHSPLVIPRLDHYTPLMLPSARTEHILALLLTLHACTDRCTETLISFCCLMLMYVR